MNIRNPLIAAVLSLTIVAGSTAAAAPEKTVTISAYDTMKFSVNQIEAAPGQKITIQLKNEGSLPKTVMGHNWVLLKAGVDPNTYAKLATRAQAQGYEPQSLSNVVLASIPLLGGGETGSVKFTAPTAPGTYAYMCSCPGHGSAGMKGVLIVK